MRLLPAWRWPLFKKEKQKLRPKIVARGRKHLRRTIVRPSIYRIFLKRLDILSNGVHTHKGGGPGRQNIDDLPSGTGRSDLPPRLGAGIQKIKEAFAYQKSIAEGSVYLEFIIKQKKGQKGEETFHRFLPDNKFEGWKMPSYTIKNFDPGYEVWAYYLPSKTGKTSPLKVTGKLWTNWLNKRLHEFPEISIPMGKTGIWQLGAKKGKSTAWDTKKSLLVSPKKQALMEAKGIPKAKDYNAFLIVEEEKVDAIVKPQILSPSKGTENKTPVSNLNLKGKVALLAGHYDGEVTVQVRNRTEKEGELEVELLQVPIGEEFSIKLKAIEYETHTIEVEVIPEPHKVVAITRKALTWVHNGTVPKVEVKIIDPIGYSTVESNTPELTLWGGLTHVAGMKPDEVKVLARSLKHPPSSGVYATQEKIIKYDKLVWNTFKFTLPGEFDKLHVLELETPTVKDTIIGNMDVVIEVELIKPPPPPKPSKVTLKTIKCNRTEDWIGEDECELRISVDGKMKNVLNKDLNDKESWKLNKVYSFTDNVVIQLWELDDPGFPWYDDHDHLGSVFIAPSNDSKQTKANLTRDGASYTLTYNLEPGDDFPKIKALEALEEFRKSNKSGKFTKVDKTQLTDEIEERVNNPIVMDQLNQSLCGPIAILVALAMKDPELYVKMAQSIYEQGKFQVRGESIHPTNKDLFTTDVPVNKDGDEMPHLDWMLAASMRDAENALFDFDKDDKFEGITTPWEMEEWMEILLGCSETEHISTWTYGEVNALKQARNAVEAGNVAALLIDKGYLPGQHPKTFLTFNINHPNHWVLLLGVDSIKSTMKFEVFTWGKKKPVTVPLPKFEDLMWGAVIGYY